MKLNFENRIDFVLKPAQFCGTKKVLIHSQYLDSCKYKHAFAKSVKPKNFYSMKNIQFIFAFVCLSMATAFSQSGKLNISAGVGFEPTTVMDDAEVTSLPTTFKVGYQITPMFCLNAFGGHSASTSEPRVVNDGLALKTTTKQTFLGLRGELKHGFGERFEVYGGAALGYVLKNSSEFTTNGTKYTRNPEAPSPFDPNAPKGQALYAGFVGTNFFVLKNVGLYAEVGYGVTLFSGGITARF